MEANCFCSSRER